MESWKKLHDALQITGHDTVSGLDQWMRRWNRANPANMIIRVPGRVDAVSLRAAFRHYVAQRNVSVTNRDAIAKHIINKKRRPGSNRNVSH